MANSLLVNLKGYWKFDEASGNAADSSGNGNTLTSHAISYGAGKLNNAVNLVKATPSWLSLANASQTGLGITGDLSINTWTKLTSSPGASDDYPIFWKYATAGQHSYGFRLQNAPTLQFVASSDGSTDTAGSVSWTPSTATYYMLTCVYSASGGSVKFYVNSVQQGTTQTGLATSLFNGTSNILVGDRLDAGDPTTNWDGQFDEMGIWAKAFTQTDIDNLYGGGTPLAFGSFDNGSVAGAIVTPNMLLMGLG